MTERARNEGIPYLIKLYLALPRDQRPVFRELLDAIDKVTLEREGENTKPESSPTLILSPITSVRRRGPKISQHPLPKNEEGKILAPSIKYFADHHIPQIKYEGMNTALDVLTACKSPDGKYYSFHYDIIDYRNDGVYIQKENGRGYRTDKEYVNNWRRRAAGLLE